MCLHPQPVPEVPEETARIARAAFRRGNPYLRLREEFPLLFADPQFKALFPAVGQPAEAPWRLALVTLMQFAEGLSDRQAAEAVRSRIDWKYLLGLELDDAGFDSSLLCEFRARLLEHQAESLLFETLLTAAKERGLLKSRGKQRTDSTHVLAAIRTLNRLELVGETMRTALEALAQAAPDWLAAHARAEWLLRYGRRFEQYRLPKGEAKREAFAVMIGEDGFSLLEALHERAADEPAAAERQRRLQLPAVETLAQVWLQQYEREGAAVRWLPAAALPPAPEAINSPHDPQARYSQKGTHEPLEWIGYKTHLTECCDPDMPLLITDVRTTPAPVPDSEVLPQIHAALSQRGLLPSTHLVDAGYTEAEQLVESQRKYGVRLVGPLESDTSWQARAATGFAASDFAIDWEAQRVRCPGGKQSVGWKETNKHLRSVIQVDFARRDCQPCAHRSQCTRAKEGRRRLTLLPEAQHQARQVGRVQQGTAAFAKEYAARAGVEGTHSQAVRRCGLRECRYVGDAKTHLQHLFTAAAVNLVRLADWLAHTPRRTTRQSPLVGVIPAPATPC